MREVFPVGKQYRLRVQVTLAEVDELGNDVDGTVAGEEMSVVGSLYRLDTLADGLSKVARHSVFAVVGYEKDKEVSSLDKMPF